MIKPNCGQVMHNVINFVNNQLITLDTHPFYQQYVSLFINRMWINIFLFKKFSKNKKKQPNKKISFTF